MRSTRARRSFCPLAMMAIWLLVASAMVPAPAGATLMEYTYTGNNFLGYPTVPPIPDIGPNLTIEFTYDGPIPDGGAVITDFTITSGALQLSLPSGDLSKVDGWVIAASNGLPVYWEFYVRVDPYDIESYWTRNTGHRDEIIYSGPGGEAEVIAFSSGTWTATPVPLPPTALLLGSGLIPLVWFRRRNLLGK